MLASLTRTANTAPMALAGGAGVTALGMGLLAPVLPSYAESLGASAALVGLLVASFGATRLLVSLPAAWLAQHAGPRRLLIGSPAAAAPAAVLCALAGGFWMLALFCLVEGAAAAVYATVGTAAVASDADEKRRGRALATYQVAGLLGTALGAAIGGLVGQQLGPRAPFLIYAALAALTAGWLHRALEPSPLAAEDARAPADEAPRRPWRLALTPRLLVLWPLAFGLVFARVGTQLVAAPLLGASRLGLGPQQIGLALSLGGLAALGPFYAGGWLADRYGREVVVVPAALGMVGALAVLAVRNDYVAFVLATVLLGAGGGLAGPAPLAYVADAVADIDRTTAVGLYRTLGDAGATLAPPVMGWLADADGYGAAFGAAEALLLVAVIIFAWGAGRYTRSVAEIGLPGDSADV